jgi:mRNA-degrading endonuclease toxin of MazEF toxin-antitoxin module
MFEKISGMKKDFDMWNDKKKNIHAKRNNKFYNTREIWWCSLGINVGFEHDGDGDEFQRPVLILKGLSANTCLAIPLTASPKLHRMRIPIGMVNGKQASTLISQMRVIDSKRLLGKVRFLDKEKFELTRKAVRDML